MLSPKWFRPVASCTFRFWKVIIGKRGYPNRGGKHNLNHEVGASSSGIRRDSRRPGWWCFRQWFTSPPQRQKNSDSSTLRSSTPSALCGGCGPPLQVPRNKDSEMPLEHANRLLFGGFLDQRATFCIFMHFPSVPVSSASHLLGVELAVLVLLPAPKLG